MILPVKKNELAIWALTPKGANLAAKLAKELQKADLFVSSNLKKPAASALRFSKLSDALQNCFNKYHGHIFIMSTGIVIRMIAPLIKSKISDPAVIVVDETGHHAISLLSGHIGGANDLTKKVARLIGADPVITTATDLNDLPAIDIWAQKKGLFIENPEAIKNINMAILTDQKINIYDPSGLLQKSEAISNFLQNTDFEKKQFNKDTPGIYINYLKVDLYSNILVLRPKILVAGIGCNRNTPMEEIRLLLDDVLNRFSLAAGSLVRIASIDLKKDETGLIALAKELELPLNFFDKKELNSVKNIKTPSVMVEKHIGVKSVCEAAAILAAKQGKLIVPKQSTRNVTVAIAKTASM